LKKPIAKQATQQEWNIIHATAQNNGVPKHIIHNLKKKLISKKRNTETSYLIKATDQEMGYIHILLPINTKNRQPLQKNKLKCSLTSHKYNISTTNRKPAKTNPSGIYKLKSNRCNNAYIGQSERSITTRHKEHICCIKNNPASAYALHMLKNRHEYGTAEKTMKLLKSCNKRKRMDCWEIFYMQAFHQHNILIAEQQVNDINPLYKLANTSRDLLDIH
jgi:hypothetical protein